MTLQLVHCKQVRSYVRYNNENPRFSFSTRDVTKTTWVYFVKSSLVHSLSSSM